MPKQTKAARWIDPDKAEREVFVLGDHHDALETPWHSHARAQLIHVSRGVLTVRTKDGLWMVPPQRAVWILPGTLHKIASKKSFWLTTLYAKLGLDAIPEKSSVVSIDLDRRTADRGRKICVRVTRSGVRKNG